MYLTAEELLRRGQLYLPAVHPSSGGLTGLVAHTSRILLVDDNALQSATRRAILEGAGMHVDLAQQGQQALAVLAQEEASNPIALIITDHLMPVMSGPEFVTELRRRGLDLPVIVLSGLPDAESAYDGTGVVFMLKPCAPESLIRLVQDLLGADMRRSA